MVSRYTHSWSSVHRVYDNKARRYAEDNQIVRTSKLEVEATNNKTKLRSRYCTIEQ